MKRLNEQELAAGAIYVRACRRDNDDPTSAAHKTECAGPVMNEQQNRPGRKPKRDGAECIWCARGKRKC